MSSYLTLHHLTRDNLRELQNILDSTRNVSTQTGSLYDFNHSEIGIQTAHSLVDQGIQTNPVLTINTQNISSPILQSIDMSNLTSVFYTNSQSDKSIQTLFNKLEQGVQTINESNLGIPTGDLINLLESPISTSRLNRLNLEIDLSLINKTMIEISPNELIQMELLTSGIDLSLTEAYIPIPEIAMYSESLVQYLTWV